MRNRLLPGLLVVLLFAGGFLLGNRNTTVAYAGSGSSMSMRHGSIPKSYGRLVTAIPDSIGTGLVFEDKDGVIRFVSVTGMKEGELARY